MRPLFQHSAYLRKVSLTGILTVAVLLSGCKKDSIEGPQGSQGIQGEKGDKGEKGEKGDQGNANVKTVIFPAANITWNSTVTFGTNYKTATLSIPAITNDIVTNGAVLVYGGFFWESPWSAIPISFYEAGKVNFYTFGVKTGSVTLRVHNSTNAVPSAPGIAFKVVIINGQALRKAQENNIRLDNYEEAARFLGFE